MVHNKKTNTAKTDNWFKTVEQKTTEKNNNKINKNNQTDIRKEQKSNHSPNFKQELINHRDQFLHVIAHNNQKSDSFQGILARIEADFITLINTPTVIKIPIKKITAIITNPKQVPASTLSAKEIKPIIKEVLETLFDLDI
ncbi:hypothetical protein [Acetohalobium arabaticum]|uniref:Uncharacterized protein n=1 Tax=Acetohalobium arabaticum (strain ATCC 49924 / DSM 5501 / Z-7288) TaxID=574087 RepID=D9QS31_ACEAZ|nr:hypothetical protein [Acetohalobium arabaticum]ADL13322.1 hypothetical protein Acear_1817 [Acetohalobium arabaticum DSM 5501]